VVGVATAGALLLADGPLEPSGSVDTTTNTTQNDVTPTTDVPVYDVDDDGRLDYAVIDDEVVAVPTDPPDPPDPPEESHTAEWLVFAGTVIAALIGAGGLIGVARLNRDSEDEVTELKRRIDLLEPS
jgi:hypothetical protein